MDLKSFSEISRPVYQCFRNETISTKPSSIGYKKCMLREFSAPRNHYPNERWVKWLQWGAS